MTTLSQSNIVLCINSFIKRAKFQLTSHNMEAESSYKHLFLSDSSVADLRRGSFLFSYKLRERVLLINLVTYIGDVTI